MSRKYFLLALAGLLLIVSIPYLLGFALAGKEWVFGGFLMNPIDGQSYLAKMYQGALGSWRFQLPYTSDPGNGAYIFLNYLALGHLARVTSLPPVFVFHLLRLVGVVVMASGLLSIYHETLRPTGADAEPVGEPGKDTGGAQKMAIILSLFGSGSGWLVVFFGLLPSDIWVAEMYPFLSAYANPHFPLGLGLILWLLVMNLREMNRSSGSRKELLLMACMGLLLAIIQPFGVVILAIILGGLILWEWIAERRIPLRAILAGAMSMFLGGLYLIYQYSAILVDPVLSGWNAQNVTQSPPLWDFVLSLSPALLLAGLAVWRLVRGGGLTRGERLLVVWLAAGVGLAYLPFALQRRFLTGYFVPVAGLAGLGLMILINQWPHKKVFIKRLLVGLSVMSNMIVLLIGLFGILGHAPEFYLTQDAAASLNWLKENSSPSAIILAGPEMGLYIPSQTGRRVIYGHPFETVRAAQEEQTVLAIFTGKVMGSALQQFLADRNVEYIVYGEREQALGGEPAFMNFPVVFQQGKTRIFAAREIP